MTPADLRALLAAATPGPWRVGSVDKWHVFVPCPECMGPERVLLRMNEHFPYAEDAALIAAAVNDLPGLLDRLEAAEALAEYADHSEDCELSFCAACNDGNSEHVPDHGCDCGLDAARARRGGAR